jgi:hypothetical protein
LQIVRYGPFLAVFGPLFRYASGLQFALMAPTCLLCDRPIRDESDQYLHVVQETVRGRDVHAVYFCGRSCPLAHVLVGDDWRTVDRRWVLGLA